MAKKQTDEQFQPVEATAAPEAPEQSQLEAKITELEKEKQGLMELVSEIQQDREKLSDELDALKKSSEATTPVSPAPKPAKLGVPEGCPPLGVLGWRTPGVPEWLQENAPEKFHEAFKGKTVNGKYIS